jgi:hypothetical protein
MAPRFRTDVDSHNLLMHFAPGPVAVPAVKATKLPDPAFPRFPEKLLDLEPATIPEKRDWTTPEVYRKMRGWLFAYFRLRVLPGDFHPLPPTFFWSAVQPRLLVFLGLQQQGQGRNETDERMRGVASMHNRLEKSGNPASAVGLGWLLALIIVTASPVLGSSQNFTVPDDLALRIRLDDTLTSTDSQIGDPFSATVVEKGDYQNARVYGHITQIDMSGKIKGHTSMMLRFDRLVMPDGRRAPIRAEIVELYHAPSGEKVDVEGAIESGGRGRKTVEHTVIGAGAGALLGGIFGGGKGAGIGSVIGGAGGLGTTAFHGRQKITLNSGQEMLIRITGR